MVASEKTRIRCILVESEVPMRVRVASREKRPFPLRGRLLDAGDSVGEKNDVSSVHTDLSFVF